MLQKIFFYQNISQNLHSRYIEPLLIVYDIANKKIT